MLELVFSYFLFILILIWLCFTPQERWLPYWCWYISPRCPRNTYEAKKQQARRTQNTVSAGMLCWAESTIPVIACTWTNLVSLVRNQPDKTVIHVRGYRESASLSSQLKERIEKWELPWLFSYTSGQDTETVHLDNGVAVHTSLFTRNLQRVRIGEPNFIRPVRNQATSSNEDKWN